jgi:flagellar hook-associated protein 3 FlgL
MKTGTDLARVNSQISTGKKINNLSDQPWATSELHQLRRGIQDQHHYRDASSRAVSLLTTTEYALTAAMDIVDRARVLSIQMANDTYSPEQRASAAEEVLFLKEHLLDVANTEFHGRYVFSGAAYDTASFDATFAYAGSTSNSEIDISSTRSVDVGLDGSDVFQGSIDIFQSIDDLATALSAADGTAIRDLIDDFDDGLDQLDVVRTGVGTNTKRALDMIDLTQSLQVELQGRLSSVEDVDITEALTEFSLLQTQYEINLQLTSKTRTISLFSRM